MVASRRLVSIAALLSLISFVLVAAGCGDHEPAGRRYGRSAGGAAGNASLTTAATSSPGWEPDASLLAQLGPYQDFEGYQIRLPKEWKSMSMGGGAAGGPAAMAATPGSMGGPGGPMGGGPGGDAFKPSATLVAMQMRPDGGRAMFCLAIAAAPSGSPHATTSATQEVDEMMADMKKSLALANFQQNATESGQLAGISFVRIGWQGTGGPANARVNGFNYLNKDGAKMMAAFFIDMNSQNEEMSKLATAAMLTLRKKK